jgi:hypothetical protein
VDYAKHTDGKGRVRDVDEFIADEHTDQAQRQATMLYVERLRDVEALLDMLKEEVTHHAEFARKEGVDFGHAGDLGELRRQLIEALAFLAQQEPEDVERRLNEGR